MREVGFVDKVACRPDALVVTRKSCYEKIIVSDPICTIYVLFRLTGQCAINAKSVRLAVDQSPKASGNLCDPGGHAASTRCVSWLQCPSLPTDDQAVGNASSGVQYLRGNLRVRPHLFAD